MSTFAKNRSRLANITYGGVVTVNAGIPLYAEIDSPVSFDNGIETLSGHGRPALDLTTAAAVPLAHGCGPARPVPAAVGKIR